MSLADNIKHARIEKKLTQKEMAQRLGISQQAYSQYENDKRRPKLETLQKIADALGCSIEALFVYDPEDDYKSPPWRVGPGLELHTTPLNDAVVEIDFEIEERERMAEEDGELFPISPDVKNQWRCELIPQIAEKYDIPKELLEKHCHKYSLSIKQQCHYLATSYDDLPEILKRITDIFEDLNLTGQQTAMRRLQELAQIPAYQADPAGKDK